MMDWNANSWIWEQDETNDGIFFRSTKGPMLKLGEALRMVKEIPAERVARTTVETEAGADVGETRLLSPARIRELWEQPDFPRK